MAPHADSAGSQSAPHARTDRQSAGRSSNFAPETLYLRKIAAQQARIDALESTVERQERDLQLVIDRYERLLAARDATGEPSDPDRSTDDTRTADAPAGDLDGSTDGARTADASAGVVERAIAALSRRLP